MIQLSPESVISEVWESPLYTREQAERLSQLSDEAIDAAIHLSVDENFWHAYDLTRNKVIDLLLEKIGTPTVLFPIIESCPTCGRETIHQDLATGRECGKCGTVKEVGDTLG